MISRLNGKLITSQPPRVVVDVSGVGYEVDLPITDCALLPDIGIEVILYTHLVIREDDHLLYGFLSIENRDCFRQLIKVSGIGPKIGLALLSSLTLSELQLALASSDIDTLCKAPGVGKKMAERMLLELKGKISFAAGSSTNTKILSADIVAEKALRHDVSNALLSLGYAEKEVREVLKQLPMEITDLSHGIKEALKLLNRF